MYITQIVVSFLKNGSHTSNIVGFKFLSWEILARNMRQSVGTRTNSMHLVDEADVFIDWSVMIILFIISYYKSWFKWFYFPCFGLSVQRSSLEHDLFIGTKFSEITYILNVTGCDSFIWASGYVDDQTLAMHHLFILFSQNKWTLNRRLCTSSSFSLC